jgi:ABC-2 type transport system permease protein
MFKNTFTKTLYVKRWMMLSWGLGLGLLTTFTMTLFPTFKDIGESFKDVPESLKAFLGDANTYRTIEGFTDLQVFGQMHFMLIILGVILFTGILAGEENEGTLQTLLVQPVRRGRVFFEKLFGAMTVLGVVCAALFVFAVIGALVVGERLPLDRLFYVVLGTWLITLVFSTLGFALGAVLGRRGIAGSLAGVLAFISLLINTLSESVSWLKNVDKFLPFHYFNKPGILQNGVVWRDLVILAAISVIFILIALPVFKRRDIYEQ